MSGSAKINFLPWMRRGLVRTLAETADSDGVPASEIGSVEAAVTVGETEVTRQVKVRGPSAVIGINASQVVREEPKSGSMDFERNYFPFVDLASPDLPWQFTPAGPNVDKLMPWLVLVVVEERDGISYGNVSTGPLPVLSIDDGAGRELPSLREAWAWTHVQASTSLGDDVDAAFSGRPEAFVARLMCPRVLGLSTWYRACLVPSFEQGRQAGLGWEVSAASTELAWSATTESIELPVFHTWRFRTSREPGDFESLVKELTARTLRGSMGVHDLDIGRPGSDRLPDEPGAIVGFQGALVSPNVEVPPWDAAHQEEFQGGLREMLNEALLAEDSELAGRSYQALNHDPVVAPPAYGAMPANEDQIPEFGHDPQWLAEANLDGALRSAAGLGAEVVRRNQETLVAEAWDQAGALNEVNRTLNNARLALEVGRRMKARVDEMRDGTRLQITRGAHARLKRSDMDTTLLGRVRQSVLPNGLFSAALRRRLRAGSPIGMATTAESESDSTFISGLTEAFVAAPETKLAYAVPTIPYGTVMGEEMAEPDVDADLDDVVRSVNQVDFGLIGNMTPRSRQVPKRPGLSIEDRVPMGRTFERVPVPLPPGRVLDSRRRRRRSPIPVSADRRTFFDSARTVSTIPVAVDQGGADALSLAELAEVVSDKLDPAALLRTRVRSIIKAPEGAFGDADVPASLSFSPEYSNAIYDLLVKIDSELLMPGVRSIRDKTIALAGLNASFVEAFLLGANDELSREFVWREVPVSASDTWLRTFWDSVEEGVEDIRHVARWNDNPLGTHQPAGGMDPDKVLVLIIKGDLLRRYPTTLIYAVPGKWDRDEDEETGEEIWERVEDEDEDRVWPIFVGSLGRGVTFLGFEFDVADVDTDVAGSTEQAEDRPGWFFAFEQPPTDPRFGLDVGSDEHIGTAFEYWKYVTWHNAMGAQESEWSETHAPVSVMSGTTKQIDATDEDRDDENSFEETWGRNAAAMAVITLQRPVRMLVHADQMLRPEEEA